MEGTRATWTDERLDDLRRGVDEGFRRVDERFVAVDARFNAIDARFNAIDARFNAIDGRFDALESRFDARFDALQRMIIQVGGAMIATFVVGFAGLIATQL